MPIEKIMDRVARENVIEGLIKRIQREKVAHSRATFERMLKREADRYERDFGHKYKRVFRDYTAECSSFKLCFFYDEAKCRDINYQDNCGHRRTDGLQ